MEYSIEVPCRKRNLRKVRAFIQNVLEYYYVSTVDANLMVLAVDELCTNLMVHSHSCDPDKCLEVKVTKDEQFFMFEIHDLDGDFFNFIDYQLPEVKQLIKDRRNGGLGLILVKKIMDEIRMDRYEGRNICRLYKRTPNQAAAVS